MVSRCQPLYKEHFWGEISAPSITLFFAVMVQICLIRAEMSLALFCFFHVKPLKGIPCIAGMCSDSAAGDPFL